MRIFILTFIFQFALLSSASAQLSPSERKDIIFACTQLVNDYAYYRDEHDPDKFSDLFTENARMTARGEWINGREALAEHVMDLDPNNLRMHMISTVKINPIDAQNATGVTYASVIYQQTGVAVSGKYFDKFVNTADGWKISERTFNVIYRRPAEQ